MQSLLATPLRATSYLTPLCSWGYLSSIFCISCLDYRHHTVNTYHPNNFHNTFILLLLLLYVQDVCVHTLVHTWRSEDSFRIASLLSLCGPLGELQGPNSHCQLGQPKRTVSIDYLITKSLVIYGYFYRCLI